MISDSVYDNYNDLNNCISFTSPVLSNGKESGSEKAPEFYQLAFHTPEEDDWATSSKVAHPSLNTSSTPSIEHNGQDLENLVQENLSLQQKLNRKSDELTEARAHLRGYSNFADGFNNNSICRQRWMSLDWTHYVLTGILLILDYCRCLMYLNLRGF
uniref:Uncharacterized protein n=1 Tax=Ditylenchus dipsaci TaxID=166011 RepID=A0A915EF54_9BILA